MIRKLILALGATAVLGAAALTPTTASAWSHGHHGHWHGGYGLGIGLYAPTLVAAEDCYVVKQKVLMPFGWRIRNVTMCD
jgi:hypothetical protein